MVFLFSHVCSLIRLWGSLNWSPAAVVAQSQFTKRRQTKEGTGVDHKTCITENPQAHGMGVQAQEHDGKQDMSSTEVKRLQSSTQRARTKQRHVVH